VSRRTNAAVVALLAAFAIWKPGAQAQFETRAILPLSGDLYSLMTGDFNGDGIPDVAVVNAGGGVTILLGNGDGTFRVGASYSVEVLFYGVTASLRNNGILDLVLGGGDDTVYVMLGNGDGTFQSPVGYATSAENIMVALGDFTGHGHLDIASLESNSDQGVGCNCVQILPGNGDGTFGAPVSTTPVPYDVTGFSLAAGDFNNDGKLDLAVGGEFGESSKLDVLLGNGDGTFTDDGYYVIGGEPSAIATGYFTSNERNLDLAVSAGGGIYVLLGNGDGTFQQPVPYTMGADIASWVIAQDLDGDGKIDLATSDLEFRPGVDVLKGNGDGTFQTATFYPVGIHGGPNYIVAADFNNDGKPDLAVVGGEQLTTLLNTGSATFSPTSPLTFSNQLLGTTSSPQTVTLTNSGTTAMTISSVKSSGAPFRMTANTCTGSLAPGAQCSITAEFTAQVKGTVSGGITIIDSASSKPQFVELIGIGTQLAISASKLTFPAQAVGTKSTPRYIHVVNTGATNVGFTHFIYIDGGDAPFDFVETNDCGSYLAPKASCTIIVTFEPRQTGTRDSILYLNDDGGDSPQTIRLIGTGD
jgi:hypothetical protein